MFTSKKAFPPRGARAGSSEEQVCEPVPTCPSLGSLLPCAPHTHVCQEKGLIQDNRAYPPVTSSLTHLGSAQTGSVMLTTVPTGLDRQKLIHLILAIIWASGQFALPLYCQISMNLFPKVSRLYFSNSFQACLCCLLPFFSCKNE